MAQYYKHPQTADGYLNKCKDCAKRDSRVGNVPRVCLECNKEFMAVASEVNRGGAKTCSRSCYYNRLRKLLNGKYADKTTYDTIHKWVYKNNGKAHKCELCDVKGAKAYHWSNKSGEYLQELDDWWQLCVKCHHAYDSISTKAWATRKIKYGNGFKKGSI